jgi:hypothetical protein
VREECGLELPASALRLAGVISIDLGKRRTGVLLLVFTAECEQVALTSAAEGTLEWHRLAELDGLPLVPDLAWLLPRIWNARMVFAHYGYDAAGRLVISPVE